MNQMSNVFGFYRFIGFEMYNDGDPMPIGKYGEQSSMSLIIVHISGKK